MSDLHRPCIFLCIIILVGLSDASAEVMQRDSMDGNQLYRASGCSQQVVLADQPYLSEVESPSLFDIIVPDDYPTIQEAIDHATEYSKIYVRSGLYEEQIVVDVNALQIIGEDLFTTVIQGNDHGATVEVHAFLVTISGFNISYSDLGLTFNGSSPTFNTICGNTFFSNAIGIQIGGIARSNLIYHNNFLQNQLHALDPYENTMWYDSDIQEGNYWDDYTGADADTDGIGDSPYEIPGNHSQDSYPLMSVYYDSASPNQPSTPVGIRQGHIKDTYRYSSQASDPRSLELFYWFEWGDGNDSGWIGPIPSGLSCNASHAWDQTGQYHLRVRVKNSAGAFSRWSDPLVVSMPKKLSVDMTHWEQRIFHCISFNPIARFLISNNNNDKFC